MWDNFQPRRLMKFRMSMWELNFMALPFWSMMVPLCSEPRSMMTLLFEENSPDEMVVISQ